jgi:hypothetical protein
MATLSIAIDSGLEKKYEVNYQSDIVMPKDMNTSEVYEFNSKKAVKLFIGDCKRSMDDSDITIITDHTGDFNEYE